MTITHPMIQTDLLQRLQYVSNMAHMLQPMPAMIVRDLQTKVMAQGVDSLTPAEVLWLATLMVEGQAFERRFAKLKDASTRMPPEYPL